MLVNQFAFLPVDFRGIRFRELFERVENCHMDGILLATLRDGVSA
jgi:hypothetical protein